MDKSDRQKYAENSKIAWNEAAAAQKPHNHQKLIEGFREPGHIAIPAIRLETLRKHGIEGKAVFQPCCNKALDLLSLKNLGASRCFGFDISSAFIQQGKDIAASGGIDCELIQANVYELDESRNGQFDIGLITLGTFMWMPDLDDFFKALRSLFRPNGWLFIHEFHPISEVVRFVRNGENARMELVGNYFDKDPKLWTKGLDYLGGTQYDATPTYRFLHKISDVIDVMAHNGFVIESFREYDVNLKEKVFGELGKIPLPGSYTLTAHYRPDN